MVFDRSTDSYVFGQKGSLENDYNVRAADGNVSSFVTARADNPGGRVNGAAPLDKCAIVCY